VIRETASAFALYDAFPAADGHVLILPKDHVRSLYELPVAIQAELWQLAAEMRNWLKQELNPDGFNIGLNDGEAAGQTVDHAHIHIIPRRTGDVEDPRGGVRWVLPERAKYWG